MAEMSTHLPATRRRRRAGLTLPRFDRPSRDRLIRASDFPHMNSTFSNAREFVETSFPGMAHADVQKIVADNAVALYKLEAAPPVAG